ncbi:DUF6248 family natural product biosynthesis protein [Streptomyces marianii]|uniref:Uncharacterized protein n=1 Tax=Streptomyces marianii TaxID=1817406 RepID=A0A5R9DUG5_9ACTN|nr:DUF6248 family natural product biosynthesis protein [Streptomyces marianii]TLQ39431.1 hypothetical protein FEF34_39330 [Streptomyces marianii]
MTVLRRPQRRLTAAEREVVARAQTLYLHRMLHLGLVDPVPNPSPMSEAEGAWVRTEVWPSFLHRIDDGYAWGFWRWSFCERGTCWNCLGGRCDNCLHRRKGRPDACDNAETVHNHRGQSVATLVVRPGGEPCVWWCRCPCPKDGEAAAGADLAVEAGRQARSVSHAPGDEQRGQEALPGLELVGRPTSRPAPRQ